MRYYNSVLLAVVLIGIAITGCDSGGSADSGSGQSEMDRMAQQLEQENAAKSKADAEAAAKAAAAPKPEVIPEEPSVVTSNDMKKGSTLRGQGGYLSAVGAARFSAEHNMILNNVTHALQLYNAEHGNYPKTHDEFIKKIIEPNEIKLPELEPGYEYIYDPTDHVLKKRPIKEGEAERLK